MIRRKQKKGGWVQAKEGGRTGKVEGNRREKRVMQFRKGERRQEKGMNTGEGRRRDKEDNKRGMETRQGGKERRENEG